MARSDSAAGPPDAPDQGFVSPCVTCGKCSEAGPVDVAEAEPDQATAERELFEVLRAEQARGPAWEHVVVALSEYAVQVLDPWIWTGEIYRQLAEKQIRLKAGVSEREALAAERDYRHEVIERTVAAALRKFRDQVQAGQGWDPCQGAQLRTYFIRTCLLQFPAAFGEGLRWRRIHQPIPPEYDTIAELLDARRSSVATEDPSVMVTSRILLEKYLAMLTETDKMILLAVANGYTQREVAHLFPNQAFTPKAIERRLYRIREHARLHLRSQE
ncbi:hypothetical protein [Nocardia asteroides]|uniref:hypothetical protein n=1 Tax=Nocardia asteroides TaxID=1824 RepID=UPI001E55ADC1|nr:hypothetical protein [Nocardia asteroides]UGT59116.1 hypothetical protein LTT61_17640 [Nocardia asteroides]